MVSVGGEIMQSESGSLINWRVSQIVMALQLAFLYVEVCLTPN